MNPTFGAYLQAHAAPGSNKAPSYLRALELLSGILRQPTDLYPSGVDFATISSSAELARIYDFALQNQKNPHGPFLTQGLPPSYGANGYYSAALKAYGEFISGAGYERRLRQRLQKTSLQTGVQVAAELEEEAFDDDEFSAELSRLQARSLEDYRREVKTRLHQSFFRSMLLENYQNRCALTGLELPPVLRASHILPWSEAPEHRLNPCNGIILSATYDAAFDQGLISFDDDFRLILAPAIKAQDQQKGIAESFLNLEGRKLHLPLRYPPALDLLAFHRRLLVS